MLLDGHRIKRPHAMKEPHAQLILQKLDLMTDCRGSHEQFVCLPLFRNGAARQSIPYFASPTTCQACYRLTDRVHYLRGQGPLSPVTDLTTVSNCRALRPMSPRQACEDRRRVSGLPEQDAQHRVTYQALEFRACCAFSKIYGDKPRRCSASPSFARRKLLPV